MSAQNLENYFEPFRENIIGREQHFTTPYGEKEIIYADWTASARGYALIEDCLQHNILPFYANTHTQTTITGTLMTQAYDEAKAIIKKHVNANHDDVLIFCGSGMTSAVNKLQRLMGMRQTERWVDYLTFGRFPEIDERLRPVVFITTMEHHSNHISWLETIATVERIAQTDEGLVDLEHFERLLISYKDRKNKIAAVTACSNVTGIQTPYHEMARMIHRYDGLCFVDFASSAPYIKMDMHPGDQDACLDAIYFSMHKFLGGPGTPGVLIFNKKIYNNAVPDHPGGGTILYTNPWKGRKYINDIESREDGGTPPVLQGIKASLCIRLKEEMGTENMLKREDELLEIALTRFSEIPHINVLQGNIRNRLGIISFIVEDAHYNLMVRLLNDKFGIQTRGGCSCAGTYGHYLLHVNQTYSKKIWQEIDSGDLSSKPGWIRLSLHPTMTNQELSFILDAIESTIQNLKVWSRDYSYDSLSNEYIHHKESRSQPQIENWFKPYRVKREVEAY